MHITTHVIWEITTSNQHMWHMTTRFQLIFTSCILTNPTDPENKRIYSQKKHAFYIYRRKIFLKKACFFYMLIWLSSQKTFSLKISYIQFEHMFAYYCIVIILIIKKLLYNVKKYANSSKKGYSCLLVPFFFLYF